MNPRVSIVVAAKDSLPDLRRFVGEFLDRRPPETSLVVVDGGSSDGTRDWLDSVAAGGHGDAVRWISEPDAGIAQAWNRGVGMADGQWLVFLGCDDRLGEPAAWRLAVEALGRLPAECGVAAFPVDVVSPSGIPIESIAPRLGRNGEAFLAVNTLPHQGCFHRRDLWSRLGGFDAGFPVASDYEFLLRTLVAGIGIRVCEGPAPVRMAFGGVSKRDPLENLREFRAAQLRHGVRRFRLAWWAAWLRARLRAGLQPLLGFDAAARAADAGRRIRGLPNVWTQP